MTTPAPIGTAHHHATKLDTIAAAIFVQSTTPKYPGHNPLLAYMGGHEHTRSYLLGQAYIQAAHDIAELDRIEREKEKA